MKTILLIDDDQELTQMLSDYLKVEGFNCARAYDGRSGLELASAPEANWDLVILDVMLPEKNGFEVLSSLRNQGLRVPVIMLTAKGDSVDKIVGLEMGADDYLGKPFNPRELLARIRTVLRRIAESPVPTPAEDASPAGGFQLDDKSFLARYQGRDLELTGVEFQILQILVTNIGSIVQRDKLFLEVLGRRQHPFDRSLDMHISRLRKKIWPDSEGSEKIKSIRGQGYILVPDRSR